MRVVVLDGTRFIGRAVVDALSLPATSLSSATAASRSRSAFPQRPIYTATAANLPGTGTMAAFAAGALVACLAMTAADARLALDGLPDPGLHRMVLSPQDVYRACAIVEPGCRRRRQGAGEPLGRCASPATLHPDHSSTRTRDGGRRAGKVVGLRSRASSHGAAPSRASTRALDPPVSPPRMRATISRPR
jgi:hypothetical protein